MGELSWHYRGEGERKCPLCGFNSKIKAGKMETSARQSCPFCKILNRELPASVVREDEDTLAILDIYPATRGHILVLPKRHIENIYTLPPELGARIMAAAVQVAAAVKVSLAPDGINLLQSNELAAGQSVCHFHLHIVPRYKRDTVRLKFGHHSELADRGELEQIAALVRAAIRNQ